MAPEAAHTAPAAKPLTIKQAYDKGWASSLTDADWDEAADRFDRKYGWAKAIREAWMDGWSDRTIGHKKGHALRCKNPDAELHGHDVCEFEPGSGHLR